MLFELFADLVVILHLVFILFVLFGALLVLWRKWWLYFHLPALAWGILVEAYHWTCPLTPLEQWLRNFVNGREYSGGFVEQYLIPIVYPAGLTHDMQAILAWIVGIVNLVIYTAVGVRLKYLKLDQ